MVTPPSNPITTANLLWGLPLESHKRVDSHNVCPTDPLVRPLPLYTPMPRLSTIPTQDVLCHGRIPPSTAILPISAP